MGPGGVLQVVAGCCVFAGVFAAVTHYLELLVLWDRVSPRLHRRRPAEPRSRAIEDVACDVRRLGRRFRCPPPGTRYVKVEALRLAYDAALAEACLAVDVEHLLGVLPAGPELDRERDRVEVALTGRGMVLDPADTSGR